ncbi:MULTISPECIES: TatD family hydrolase [Gordonia]|jgi:TatD DNase family protein|uniref:DNAase n=1 Tax=Gordonia alkanivorans CGMCC 6845 TaxID=1423140 RepID=W9DG65_9ACTN|nr:MULTISPECIES: TatD family hydrolase [Gordonia]AZZ83117.1 TatD family deoxyribonuclease [Gordonia alkanivorans]ETA08553.1 DNAase [Gordonia alkanivorans CGMCC 6845]MDH3005215.1 TatD family hydrolase [Gordonia alkanivorans]MDH3010488.1 TatD family hydrolase [Gordonia alkanivorans]MDH3014627.1 TatD family hydrolase [Gordonia alkanivorans]
MSDASDAAAGPPTGATADAPAETLSNKAAKKRRRREPPPDPTPLPGLVDAHTHLAACGGRDAQSVRAILDHAQAVGVDQMVTVADDMVDARWAVAAAEWDDRVYAAVALHPMHAGDLNGETAAELEQMVRHPRVVAVGETGLDYYWPGKSDDCASPEVQHETFRWHIDLAKRVGKPLMIHNREADRDLLDILAAEGAPETVIMHCFSGDRNVARECVDRGYILSFAGTVSFANADELRVAAELVPDEQILVETDAPFLTPHPYRGQPNQSYCLPYTARAIAEVRGVPEEEMARLLGINARRAYNIPLP